MPANGLSERTAFRIAQHTFLAGGVLILMYWALVVLGKTQTPMADNATLAGAVLVMASLRASAQWLEGDRRYTYPLAILLWVAVALGGVGLIILS
jgi:hypothetical protein